MKAKANEKAKKKKKTQQKTTTTNHKKKVIFCYIFLSIRKIDDAPSIFPKQSHTANAGVVTQQATSKPAAARERRQRAPSPTPTPLRITTRVLSRFFLTFFFIFSLSFCQSPCLKQPHPTPPPHIIYPLLAATEFPLVRGKSGGRWKRERKEPGFLLPTPSPFCSPLTRNSAHLRKDYPLSQTSCLPSFHPPPPTYPFVGGHAFCCHISNADTTPTTPPTYSVTEFLVFHNCTPSPPPPLPSVRSLLWHLAVFSLACSLSPLWSTR